MMRVLLISHYYKPVKSPVKRMARIAEYLAKEHEVTVLTSLPSYPTGVLPAKYRHKLWDVEDDGRIRIIRLWDFPTPNKGFLRRTINHIMFFLAAALAVTLMKAYDLVIVSSPSFLSGLAGIYAAALGKGEFIFDVRDLWPDSAFQLGYKVNPLLRGLLKFLEKFFYQKAKKIFCATEEIRKTIIRMGIDEAKVITMVNTVDTNIFKPLKIPRGRFGLKENEFIVIYVGSLTKVQNLGTVIEAAARLKKQPKIKFLLVGEGEDKENLINQAKKFQLKNINFIAGQPTEKIIELINVADVALISLSTNKFFSDNALPTKTSEYLGCGKPIVACAGRNLKELIETNEVGVVVPPGDSQGLAAAILELFQKPAKLKKYARNARQLAIKQFSDASFYRVLEKELGT
jgi:glycosyltransferase involved in cell wall biosynthesis